MNEQVIIVEDCFVQSTVIRKMLETEHFGINKVCRSGNEALKEIQKNVPHLILMDIYIDGDMNGIETVKLIREKYNIPVLFLTALNKSDVADQIKQIQFSGLLIKPVSKPDLIANIKKVLKSYPAA
ncbi:MAG: response regulator [Balneolaceae bacterium]|nr:response regulator [Balneolaceae bacterium]